MAELNNYIAYAALTTSKSKPEELARLQAGGERSVTPATKHPDKREWAAEPSPSVHSTNILPLLRTSAVLTFTPFLSSNLCGGRISIFYIPPLHSVR